MNFKETGFRAIYHEFVIVKNNDHIRNVINGFPGAQQSNAVFAYGYYDTEAGLTLELLALALVGENDLKYSDVFEDTSIKVGIGAVEDAELLFYSDKDGKMAEKFAKKLDMLKEYDVSEAVENSRKMQFLDPCRHEHFIDDILVILDKEGLQPEGCWVRITGLADDHFFGMLLNEPNQDFGCHEKDTIPFFSHRNENGEFFCYSDFSR